MTVKERITKFIELKQISKSEFCRQIGVSNAYISSMRVGIQPDKVQRIALAYPELNIGWLLTGEGEILNNPEKNIEPLAAPCECAESSCLTVSRLLALVEAQQKTIAEQSATISRQAFALGNLAASVAPGAPSAD